MISLSCRGRGRRTPDDTIVVLIESTVNTLDPRFTLSNYDTKFSRLVAPGLVALDTTDLAPRLELAERITHTDELTWEVVMRTDLRCGDGEPMTAHDVAWTYTSMIEEGSPSVYARQFRERFTRVEAQDDRIVRFHLVAPLATFMTDLDAGVLCAHGAGDDKRFPKAGVLGAGPYRMVSLDAHRLVLEANPHYHGEVPRTRRVNIATVRDQAARITMLVGESADLAQNTVRLDLLDDVLTEEVIQVETGPSAILTYMMFNNEDPILADVRVRQAIALAIDRDAIIRAKLGGRAVKATGLIPPGAWAYEPEVPRWEHDPVRARALLEEVRREQPAGFRFRFVYKTSADQFRVALARILAAQLEAVGIEIEVRAFEFGTFFADIKKGAYQIATMQTTEIGEPDFYRAYFHSNRIPSPADPNANNRWRYRNARVDELSELGRRVVDVAERKRIYGEVQRIVATDLPIVPLWHEDNVVLMHRDLRGYLVLPNSRFNGLTTVEKD